MIEPIYTTPTGWAVYDFSHSQWSKYTFCPKQFEIMRVRGWKQKDGAALEFGKSVEDSIRYFYKEKRAPVESFEVAWNLLNATEMEKLLKESNAKPEEIESQLRTVGELQYPDRETWETMRAAGLGLMSNFAASWESFPPRDPAFPSFKNPLKVKDARTGLSYQTIPDVIDRDERGDFIADIKSMGNLIDDSVPGLVVNDMQLRTQAAATRIFRVALWNFCRKPKQREPLAPERIYEEVRAGIGGTRYLMVSHVALHAAREANGMTIDAAAEFLKIKNGKEVAKEFRGNCKADPSLKAVADKVAKKLSEANAPEYKIQWVEGTMPEEHAFEAIREEMSVVPLIQAKWFPRRGGVRFPDNQCTWCPARGICMEEIHGPRPEYDAITKEEMVPFDYRAMDGL